MVVMLCALIPIILIPIAMGHLRVVLLVAAAAVLIVGLAMMIARQRGA
jgi:hypothetical protein